MGSEEPSAGKKQQVGLLAKVLIVGRQEIENLSLVFPAGGLNLRVARHPFTAHKGLIDSSRSHCGRIPIRGRNGGLRSV